MVVVVEATLLRLFLLLLVARVILELEPETEDRLVLELLFMHMAGVMQPTHFVTVVLLVEHFAFAQEPKLLDTVVTKDAQVPVATVAEVLASELVLAELLEVQQVEIA